MTDLAKIPPQAIAAEAAVLGAILLQAGALAEVTQILTPVMFYDERNRGIYRAALEVEKQLKPVDTLTVYDYLNKNKLLEQCGGLYYLNELTAHIGSAANIAHHAKFVCEKWMLRKFISISNINTSEAYNNADPFDLLESQITAFNNILSVINLNETIKISEAAAELLDHTDKVMANKGLSGINSGFKLLDRTTGGWQNSDLIILAGRPGDGKTALALAFAINSKAPALIYSLEMSRLQLIQRMVSMISGIPLFRIRHGQMDNEDFKMFNTVVGSIERQPIWVNDKGGNYIDRICQDIKRQTRTNKIQLVIIDYLQLINYIKERGSSKNDDIGEITKRLKGLAKEMNLPIILLSQLNREVEKAAIYKPKLSYLRDSGNIEQDADLVIFIHRPGKNEDGDMATEAEIHLLKHRNGDTGKYIIEFEADNVLFKDKPYFNTEEKKMPF